MTPLQQLALAQTRRQFFASSGFSLGTAALATLMGKAAEVAPAPRPGPDTATGIGAATVNTAAPSLPATLAVGLRFTSIGRTVPAATSAGIVWYQS